jgi:hypothetical protein
VEQTARTYRLAPAVVLRLGGAALVVVAVVVLALSLVTGWLGWPVWPVLLVAALGLTMVLVAIWWALRRAYVVRLDATGYRVRLVRGAGVTRARWTDVAQASTASVHGAACVVLGLRDGRTTTVPVVLLAAHRDEFVTDVRERLRSAQA